MRLMKHWKVVSQAVCHRLHFLDVHRSGWAVMIYAGICLIAALVLYRTPVVRPCSMIRPFHQALSASVLSVAAFIGVPVTLTCSWVLGMEVSMRELLNAYEAKRLPGFVRRYAAQQIAAKARQHDADGQAQVWEERARQV